MKTLLVVLMAASGAFAQPTRRAEAVIPAPTVVYSWVAPDCTGIDGAFSQISSGCAFTKLKVTAYSSSSRVAGFYVVVSFHNTIDDYRTATTLTREKDGSFTALFIIGDPATVSIREVDAIELIEGQLVTTH